MEQQIHFCTTPDGVRIAYATVGKGPALVVPPGWVSHLELGWAIPAFRAFYETLARYHTVVRYDKRGTGLSDRERKDFSLEGEVRDLEALIDHLRLRRFALFGFSEGGPIAIAYATKYPRRVTHLILYATYAHGDAVAGDDVRASLSSLVRAEWGLGSRTLADIFLPGTDAAALEASARFQRESASKEIAAQLLDLVYKLDVVHLLPGLRVPTVVMHRQGDRAIAFRLGRELASLIPSARFVPLEGNIHAHTLGDADSLLRVITEFLGDPVTAGPAVQAEQPVAEVVPVTQDDPVAREARSLIATLDWVTLSRYRVVGNYTRYDETVRNALKDVRQKITAGFDPPSRKRENHLTWAAPGSGKTYLVQQVAASLPKTITYRELDLARHSQQEFLSGLSQLDTEDKPYLCLVDEIDAKPQESWPYEVLLPYLDAAADRGAQFVFVLAGSSGSSVAEMKERIVSRPKGADLLSRIPGANEYEIPPMNLGDRILVVLSQFRQAGQEAGREIQAVEKLSLYYVALNSRLANARQLRELAVRTIERLPTGEDRVKYDHLFGAGDPENKAFWMESLPAASDLANRFVTLED